MFRECQVENFKTCNEFAMGNNLKIKWQKNELEIEFLWARYTRKSRKIECDRWKVYLINVHPKTPLRICYLIFDFFFFFQMAHLYSMFAKQVQSYCQGKTDGAVSQCKKNMMLYGVTKLNDMEESHLDHMDPYQRNANNIRKCRVFIVKLPSILVTNIDKNPHTSL